MKYLVFVFLFVSLLVISQTNQTFHVKLVDYSKDKMAPGACGKAAFATTLKFQLIERVDSLKRGQNILVIITCPAEMPVKYTNNQEYVLTVCNSKETKKNMESSWAMVYKYDNEKLPRYWCKTLKNKE